MGSFLSSLQSTPQPPDNFYLMEMKPPQKPLTLLQLSGPRTCGQIDSGRRYPLNPNGHFSTNVLTRRRLRTDTNTQTHQQIQQWVLEPPLISGPDVLVHKASAKTSDGSQSGGGDENEIDQPLDFKLDNLTAFNIDNRDRTIEKLRNELKVLRGQLSSARKEIETLKEHLADSE